MVKRLRTMVQQGFERAGYEVAGAENADFLIAYTVSLRDAETTTAMRSYSGYAREWGDDWGRDRGWNVVGPPITYSRMTDLGSLNLFVVDRPSGDPVWHAVAVTLVQPEDSIRKRDERLARAIDQMLRHFPPAAAAKD